MQNHEENLASRVNGSLQPLLGVTVTVKTPTGLLATIYNDDGVTVQPNPMFTNANGLYGFRAANGPYKLTFSGPQIESYDRDIDLYDPDDEPPLTQAQAALPSAASRFGFQADDDGAQARTIENKLRDTISVKDFGAQGNGVADDTAALQAAFSSCKVSGKELRIPAGRYRTTQRIAITVSASQNLKVRGDGFGKSVIMKDATNTDAILRIGSPTSTSFSSNIDMSGFTVEGAGTLATSAGVELFDVVQSRIMVRARLCDVGLKTNGGISLDLSGSDLSNNRTGFMGTKFTSLAGGGWPNVINLERANIKNNTRRGVDFDYGRVLSLRGCDIETNGTSGDPTTAGVWVGSHIGEESGLISPGVCIGGGTWLEANAGLGALVFESGRNAVKDAYFVANAGATYDVHVSGGRYSLRECDFDTNKTANIYETAGVSAKNYIINCDYGAASIDPAKTVVMGASGLQNIAIGATTLNATGQSSLGGAEGAEAFRAKTQAGGVNRVFAKGGTTGAPAQFGVEGETNASFYGVVGGAGIWQFTTGGGAFEQVRINHTAGATRALILTGGTVDSFISSTAGGIQFGCIPKLPTYTVATLPAASGNTKGLIYVSDGASNKRLAVCDGTNWRWPDGAIVS